MLTEIWWNAEKIVEILIKKYWLKIVKNFKEILRRTKKIRKSIQRNTVNTLKNVLGLNLKKILKT